jgi:hypothetical protein
MRRIVPLFMLTLLAVACAHGQMLVSYAGIQPEQTPVAASAFISTLSTAQQARASIVPMHFAGEPQSWHFPDLVAYGVVFQLAATDPDSHRDSGYASMPIVKTCGPSGACSGLNAWNVSSYQTMAEAKAQYDALPANMKATAILLSTVATNQPYVLVVQSAFAYAP